jgi:hypothetical protein
MFADRSDKAIAEVMQEACKNFCGAAKEIGGAAKELRGAAKELRGATKELKDIILIVIGVNVIGAGFYGIQWAWRR